MLKRKVSAIWVLILAVITVFACAFAAVTYIYPLRQAYVNTESKRDR